MIAIVVWIICGIIGVTWGMSMFKKKGQSSAAGGIVGGLLGFILGIIGLAILFVIGLVLPNKAAQQTIYSPQQPAVSPAYFQQPTALPPTAPGSDKVKRLQEAKLLMDEGLITQAEFDQMKSEILKS